ncbi:MAG: precorrin-6A reductase [Deferribacteraceae bacterium]|jgi:precorrin-6A/cobalt-precorrin-6A reductase|nr:precorrin-6A reductase [Deferribacteraceae bacterium]
MILVLGGTSDSIDYINALNADFIVSVATDYGYNHFKSLYGDRVRQIRFTEKTLREFIVENCITAVVDCTHPFAHEITQIAVTVCQSLNIPYHDNIRKSEPLYYDKLIYVDSFEEAVVVLSRFKGKLFFTIGSKNLHIFREFLDNAVVRVLDDLASVQICRELGVSDSDIIAARGGFSVDDNLRVIDEHKIACIISKDSGERGGVPQKLEAAIKSDIYMIIIRAKCKL